MHPALWISKTGLDAQQMGISVTSNNLANVNSTGYKKSRAIFQDLLYQTIQQPGGQTSVDSQHPTGLTLGTGVKVVGTQKEFSEGSIVQSNNPLDMAINGRGFFQVTMPDGTTAYTRAGQFQLDGQGQMVTPSGYRLEPAVTIPNSALSITVGSDGTISVLTAGNASPTTVGTLQTADFINPAGLQPVGENLFRETAASGTATTANPGTSGLGTLMQGSLESSNVNVVEELVNMIETQRAYEMNSKAISTVDSMLQFINQNL